MLTIEKIDTNNRAQVRNFTRFPYKLYKDHPQWVPPLLMDAEMLLNRQKHPFYEHSDADFFMAMRDGQIAGRIAALENKPYNKYHGKRQAQFYLFECQDDQEVANALFEQIFAWARERNLNQIVGPKGFSTLDGYGFLVEGFEYRQNMTMTNYNYPYYSHLAESVGFVKEIEFISCHLTADSFPPFDRIHRIAQRVEQRGTLKVHRFTTKAELRTWAKRIGVTYNNSFINNWEYYPVTEKEINYLLDTLLLLAVPKLIKIITHGEEVVGFVFAFPDISAALQRAKGHLLPFGMIDILLEMRRTKWIALNGAGILPEFQGHGGNALMYAELEKTILESGYQHAELTQVAETAVQMRKDLENLGGKPYKNHRVYRKDL